MSALIPFNDLRSMAAAMAKSGLFGMKTEDQAIALMLVAQSEGQHPATIAQDYDIIQGRAARKTHSVLARFQTMGGSVQWHALSETEADATFSHAQGGSIRIKWTIDQAKRAGLIGKDNWRNYPRAMLRARCIAEGVRACFPAAIGGLLVAEEARDMPPQVEPKHMGEAQVLADVDALIADALLTKTDAEALQLWKDNNGKLKHQPEDHARLKQAITDHRQALRSVPTLPPAQPEPSTPDDEFMSAYEREEAAQEVRA